MEIDLHGKTHPEGLELIEEYMLLNSTKGSFSLTVITGNSPAMQKKIINQICIKHGFQGAGGVGKLNLQAVINSAASSLPEDRIQGTKLQRSARRRLGLRTTASGRSPGAWSPGFGPRGGRASSRIDHGLKV